MAEELINQYIDEAAIKRQTDFLLSQLDTISKKFDDLEKREINVKGAGGTKDLVDGLNQLATASQTASKAQDELSKSRINAEKVAQQQLKTEQEVIKVIQQEEKAEQERAKTVTESAKAQTEAAKQTAAAKVSEAKAATEAAKRKDIEIKSTIALGKEQERQSKLLQQQSQAKAKADASEAKATETLTNDYKQLSLAQKDAITRYQSLVLQVGKNNPIAKAAGEEAAALTQQLKAVDEATGVYTRNVGNYGNAITKAFGSAFGVVRQLAYIVPGLGIAGIFSLIGEGISKMITDLTKGQSKLKEFTAEEISGREAAAASVADEIAKTTALKSVLDSEVSSRDQKKRALKELIELHPTYFGNLKLEGDVVSGLNTAYDNYTNSILKTAKAKASLSTLQEYYKERLNLELQLTEDLTTVNKKYSDYQDKVIEASKKGSVLPVQNFDEQTRKNIQLSAGIGELDLKIKGVLKTLDTSSAVDEILGKKTTANVKSIADAVADLRKELAGIQIKQDLGDLAPKDADIERVKAYTKAFEEIGQRGGAAGNKIVQDLKLEVSPIEQRVLENTIHELVAKINGKEKIDLDIKNQDELNKWLEKQQEAVKKYREEQKKSSESYKSYAEDEAKFYEEIAQRELVVLQTTEALKKAEVTTSYAEGKITKEEYENEILNITDKYGREGLKIQAKWLAEEVKLLPAGTKAREDAEKKLAELQIELNKKVLTDDERTAQQRASTLEKYLRKAKEIEGEVEGILRGFLNASVTAQKNNIQDLEDSQQQSYENEVARINASVLTEQEKADKLKVLEAQRKAQKDKNERDQRQADMQRARFEKAATIARITLETALAVVHELATGDPITKWVRAFAVGALGAAELAVAIATPIPKFFRGKDANNNYEGLAIVGDGGKREPIVRADGQLEMSPATPTLTWIGRDDIVFPNVDALRNRVAMSQTDRVLSNGVLLQQNNFVDLKPLEREMRGLRDAYNSRPVQNTIWTEKGVITRVQNGFSQTEYINKYARGQ